MWQLGDYLSVLDVAMKYLASRISLADKQKAAEIREALKSLYFSDETIKRLESIPSLEAFDALNYEAGRASIKQRDTRREVGRAFKILEKFGRDIGISIKAGRLVDQFMNSKKGIRHEIEATYFNMIKGGTKAQTSELVAKIEDLNSMIEDLDQQLGGAILSGK